MSSVETYYFVFFLTNLAMFDPAVAAVVAAAATLVVPPFSAGAPVWHPLEVTDRARSVLDGAGAGADR